MSSVKLHPTAVFAILNSYSRRTDRDGRIIGSLLGTYKNGVYTITDAFGVPFVEKTDELYVAINTEYHNNMYSFHRKINKKEVIVGWYSTTLANGVAVNDNSSLINEFYSSECGEPIHLVVDTTLAGDNINVKAFISRPLTIGNKPIANMFHEVKVDMCMSDSELTCLYHMIKGQNVKNEWKSSQVTSTVSSQKDMVRLSIEKLYETLLQVQSYVDDVCSGKSKPVASIGSCISDILSSLGSVNTDDMHAMIHDKKQDLLMVNYINTLVQTQLKISEKLNTIL